MRETYNLGNGIDKWFARFVLCFKPENERSGWLTSKGLHCCEDQSIGTFSCRGEWEVTEDKGEKKRLPARKVTKNDFDSVRLAFRNSTSHFHSLLSKFNFLNDKIKVSVTSLLVHLNNALLTRSENNQLGLAVTGVSGKQKNARMAIGREMTPLMTVAPSKKLGVREGTGPKKLTKKPSPSSETSVTIKAIINSSLQESTEDWCD